MAEIKNKPSTFVDTIKTETQSIFEKTINDTFIPMLQDMIFTSGTDLLHRAIYSNSDSTHDSATSKARAKRQTYERDYTAYGKKKRSNTSTAKRWNDEYMNLVYDSRAEAEEVLYKLKQRIYRNDVATIADLYSYSEIDLDDYQAGDWGWTNLDNARVVPDSGGDYIIKLPKAEPLG